MAMLSRGDDRPNEIRGTYDIARPTRSLCRGCNLPQPAPERALMNTSTANAGSHHLAG